MEITKSQFFNRKILRDADFTNRVCDFADDVEFAEYAEIDGVLVIIYYIFKKWELDETEGDLGRLSWDITNIDRVEVDYVGMDRRD